MNQILDHVLGAARQLGASDVHLKAGLPPVFRIKGDLRTLRDTPPLTAEVIGTFAVNLMNDKQRERFDKHFDADLSYGTPDGVRYRVNVFRQRGQTGMVLRIIPPEVPNFEKLNLPPTVQKLCEEERGLILVTGITGSGKSTTLAAMIDYINRTRASHVMTVEDPIEFLHKDRRSVVNQREIGFDATTFSTALRAALRQDPDVILVGEMRDEETIETALHASETGHLVMSTLHTLDAVETVNRIIGMFPPHQQQQVRIALSSVLKGVISQRLVARADGKGMVPAVEILVMTGRIRELIEDPKRTREIRDAIANGRNPYGMMTFDQCLTDLVQSRLITYEQALSSSTTPDDFALYFRGIGKVGENAPAAAKPGAAPAAPAPQAAAAPQEKTLELDSAGRPEEITIRLLASLVAAGLALSIGATGFAADDKPLIAVVPFTGPQAKKAEAVVVRALRKKTTLVPPSRWSASSKKLFAKSHKPEDIAAVAQDVGAIVVVTGLVKRDHRAWQLAISVRDGATGRSRDKLKYPLKGPRIEKSTLELLGAEVEEAFDHTLAAVNQPGGIEGDESKKPKPPTTGKKPKVSAIDEGDDEQKPTKPSTVEPTAKPVAKPVANSDTKPDTSAETKPPPSGDNETPPGLANKKADAPPPQKKVQLGRPRWAPYFDAWAGATISGRSFDFTPSSLPHFSSGIVAGVRVDVTIYPLAFTHASARGVFAGLGIGATVDKPFWPASKGPDGQLYDTQELRVDGGLRWRFVLYKSVPRPELILLVGGGLHQFAISKKQDPVTNMLNDVGPPDVAYAYGSAGLGFRLHFAEWALLWVAFNYHLVFDAGTAQRADEYGPANTFGIRGQGGLDFFVYKGIKLGAMGYYERFDLTFVGSDPLPAKPGNGDLAQRAVDQYFGGVLVLGYVF